MNKFNFIAEVSSNHNKNLNRCLRFIDISKQIGFNSIKFQLFRIKELFHESVLKKSKFHRDRSKWELPIKYIKPIYLRCKKNKIKLGFTPFYLDAVDILKKYVDFFKISSYEILWDDLLIKCARSGKPVILSTGMASFDEVKNAISTLKKNNCKRITLLHCVSNYPASYKNCNLNSILFMRKKTKLNIGWSDHTKDPLLVNRAINNFKIKDIEIHLDLDGKGYEYKSGHCWLPEEAKKLIDFSNSVNFIDGKYNKKHSIAENHERKWRADKSDGLRPLKFIRNYKRNKI